MGDPESWIKWNPGWEYRFWTDEDLLAFMRDEWPDLLELYLSYPRPVQRADLARYCLLQKYGGVYADVDTVCLASLEPFAGDPRVILCEEPERHWKPARLRGLDRLWFNGTMASPPGHPFWTSVIDMCRLMAARRHGDVLETTGPLILSTAVKNWTEPDSLALNSCGLFADADVHGKKSGANPSGPFGHLALSTHLWKGSWYKRSTESWWRRKVARLRQFKDWLFSGPRLDPAKTLSNIDFALLHNEHRQRARGDHVLVLVPVCKDATNLDHCLDMLLGLEHPRDKLDIRFGLSVDHDKTQDALAAFVNQNGNFFASMGILSVKPIARSHLSKNPWGANTFRRRKEMLSRTRNDLLDKTLRPHHDWVLWIDADVAEYPKDIIASLLAAKSRIVVPHCVSTPGGPSADLSSFLVVSQPTRAGLFRFIRHGLLQPPQDWWHRRHMHDLRYLEKVPLHGVGDSMMLVDADCHLAGLRFPEKPYCHLIATEAFGLIAREASVIPLGLPHLEIIRTSDFNTIE